jgi:hypothetical protein
MTEARSSSEREVGREKLDELVRIAASLARRRTCVMGVCAKEFPLLCFKVKEQRERERRRRGPLDDPT